MDILDEAKKALQSLADSATEQADYIKLQARLSILESEQTQLERQFREVTRRAQQAPCMRQISARELNVLMERIAQIEEQIAELRQEVTKHGQQ